MNTPSSQTVSQTAMQSAHNSEQLSPYFPNLLAPLDLGLLNFATAPYGFNAFRFGREKGGFDKLAAFYAERAKGGAGLIVTGGISPNISGWVAPFAGRMTRSRREKAPCY